MTEPTPHNRRPPTPPSGDTGGTRSFFRMLEWPSALGLGSLAAFLFSLKQVNPQVRFEINLWSWIILVVGTLVAWRATHSLFRAVHDSDECQPPMAAHNQDRERKKRVLLFCFILGGGVLGSLAYALKDIPSAKRWDVTVGIGAALIFVTIALYFFWRLVRFLEHHGQSEEDTRDEHDPHD